MNIIKNENIKLYDKISALNIMKLMYNQMKLKIEEHNNEITLLKVNINKYKTKSEIMNYDEKELYFREEEKNWINQI